LKDGKNYTEAAAALRSTAAISDYLNKEQVVVTIIRPPSRYSDKK
jgi:hypothetical protein